MVGLLGRLLLGALASLSLLPIAGCGPTPVLGGTHGLLHSNGTPLRDIEVTLYQQDGSDWRRVGSGVSQPDGSFELVQPAATGSLFLGPGEYRITLHSVGTETVEFPAEFTDPAKTPLQQVWTEQDVALDLDVPQPRPAN